ncbi:hematopoietic progenitor cell antigen CD34 isoform X2 [Dunckerocampus dactyliophorus]|uniref:hematopoietic progenitor cell antigen CD34 isoform X2 n=1 Tax=Dunckerocampus dactyliophorus TaxID=161453 RepID=UPI0024053367|nr:hematopoietic progenitor cell antigen CD34 isoform X2 [Dunckerocampus dactyliophorus]
MAASASQQADRPAKMLALALLLTATIMNAGVRAQDENIITDAMPTMHAEDYIRGDMIPVVTPSDSGNEKLTVLFDFNKPAEQTTLAPTTEQTTDEEETTGAEGEAADEGQVTVDVYPDQPKVEEQQTPAPLPGRGDGPANIPGGDVVCVGKEAVHDKNAVNLKLAHSSNCENTKVRIQSVLEELCGEDCKLELYQEDNTDQILVSGQYVEDDIKGMVNKFNNDNIKDKAGVKEAVPHWRKNSKLVLVSLLLTGLLLAALLVAGYYFKTHHKNSKGVRLAESYQVDEENQANTLVSVAPLPQEPLDKVTANGESPPENGTNPSPTTNGHSSAAQTPVADTEM